MTARPRIVIKRTHTVVVVGDSNTAEPRVWFRGLITSGASFYRNQGGLGEVTWINSGISGGGMSSTLSPPTQLGSSANRTALVNNFNPHGVIIACGVNEAAFSTPWSQADFESQLGGSVDSYIANCSNLVASNILFLPSVYALGEPSGSFETEMGQVVAGMTNVATAKGCRVLDVRTGRPTTAFMTSDGTHLTESGKSYLCGRASEALVFG